MGNLTSLVELYLSSNQLTGSIPVDLMRCSQLGTLYLGVNRLEGNIPVEIGQLLSLEKLRLQNNRLSGRLPQTLQLCANLRSVDLSYNALQGILSPDIFVNASTSLTSFNLSHNYFSGTIPRNFGKLTVMTELQLSANNFSDSIPSELGNCQSLQLVDISVNNLNGTIPTTLGNLKQLVLLNVSYNQLEGPLPDAGIFVSENFSTAWFLGNPKLCGSRLPTSCSVLATASPCRGRSCSPGRLWAIVSSSAAFALLVLGVGIYTTTRLFKARRRKQTIALDSELHLSEDDLVQITGDPTNLIASGASSSVYRANLEGGPIAIKILTMSDLPGDENYEQVQKAISQMQRESRALAGLRHRNILKVLGTISTSKMTGLLLEFMPMGSLHNQLHDVRPCSLSWETRLDIALGVAQGMVYLHQEVEVPIVHRDLKPQNVLLDADMTPKLADFGISKFSNVGHADEAVTASQWCGTVGYIPPEYVHDTRVTTRGDVYSYGMILLELVTGRRPTMELSDQDGDLQSGMGMSEGDDVRSPLIDWVSRCCSVRSLSPLAVVDPSLLRGTHGHLAEKETQQINLFIQVGLLCTQDNPQSRPRMYDVLTMLTHIQRLGETPVKIPTVEEVARDAAGADEEPFLVESQ